MSKNLRDILSGLSTEIDQETLLLYLQGKLSEEKRHEIEKKIMESEFESDALDGLEQFKNKADVSILVDQLNADLRKKTDKKKIRRERMKLKDQPWLFITVIVIILLVIISYMVIQRMMQAD